MTLLTQFFKHPDPEVSLRAQKTHSLMLARDGKEITEAEYNELIEDILSIEKITENVKEMDRRNDVINNIKLIAEIAKKGASFIG